MSKTLVGKVVSDRCDKTIAVEVARHVIHPLYRKVMRRVSKIHAHDEHNACAVGDIVRILEQRPISKTKTFRLVEIVKKASREKTRGGTR